MWWSLMLLLFGGKYADMAANIDDLRFCQASAEQVRDAIDTHDLVPGSSDYAARIAEFYGRTLEEKGAADPARLAAVKATVPADVDLTERFADCASLFDASAGGGTVEEAGEVVDAMAAEDFSSAADPETAEAAAAAAADAAEAASDVPDAAIDGAPLLASLSASRRSEVRCAMLANLVMYEVGRGVSKKDYGLTPEKAETLAGRLSDAIRTETGLSDGDVRAMYKADFEGFTFAMLGNDPPEKAAQAMLDAAVAQCQPLYASIDVSGDGDGVVRGLAPAATLDGAAAPDAAQCYAILSRFLPGMTKGSKEAKDFAAMVARLEQRHYAENGNTTTAAADLAMAAAGFDDAAFEALPEARAEVQMGYCMEMAGK